MKHARCDLVRLALCGVLLCLVAGCASATATSVEVPQRAQPSIAVGFDRVLVAGFIASSVRRVDANVETARYLRTELHAKALVNVVDSEPLELSARPVDVNARLPRADQLFADVRFWRRLGEEYAGPLIVTGTVSFKSAPPRYEERQIGRRTVRIWRPGFTLTLQLVLIDGRNGQVIGTSPLRPRVAYVRLFRESPLSLYFELMRQMMPSILQAFGQRTSATRVMLR